MSSNVTEPAVCVSTCMKANPEVACHRSGDELGGPARLDHEFRREVRLAARDRELPITDPDEREIDCRRV